jgi:hypothetical protein
MNLEHLPLGTTDWEQIPCTVHPGTTGAASIRARQLGKIQIRLVDYSPDYLADHWCHRGHIVYVISGDLAIEHQHGSTSVLKAGMSYHVADGEQSSHRVVSTTGGRLFIVD